MCLRWFIECQRITVAEVAPRRNLQPQQRGRGEGRGPAIDEADAQSIATAMLIVTSRPQGRIIVVDARGFRSARKDTYHIGTHYPNLKGITEHREFQAVWVSIFTTLCDEPSAANAEPIIVVCYCKSGKNRPVALAWHLVDLRHPMR